MSDGDRLLGSRWGTAWVAFVLMLIAVAFGGYAAGAGHYWLSVAFMACAIPGVLRLARDGVEAEWCRRYHREA